MTTGKLSNSSPQAGLVQIDLITGKYSSSVYLANGRSVLWSIKLRCTEPLSNLRVDVSFSPNYAKSQSFWLASLEPGEEYAFTPGCPEYDETRLLALKDDEEGRVRVELRSDESEALLAAAEDNFTWLAYNAWAGGHEFPELLAALVLPGDEAVGGILRHVSKQLGRREDEKWPGYDEEATAVNEKIKALWGVLIQYGVDYKLPPTEGARDLCVGQRVRTPSIIREKGYSTCLDSALLIAACLTLMRLSPSVILTQGHAFLCIALRRSPLPMPCGAPLATVRNLVDQGDFIALETTFLSQGATYEMAIEGGLSNLNALGEDDAFEALDIEQIWHELGIHPIFGSYPPPNDSGMSHADARESLITARPRTRMESWQRKLLDLSLRNNMLNTRSGGKYQLPLLAPSVAELEDALAEGASYRIKTLPDTMWTDAAKVQAGGESDRRMQEAAVAMFHKRELLALVQPGALERTLQNIYTAARREMEESGSNTLFIACGFLKWLPKGANDTLSAPLLLLPVRLTRRSVRDGFTLSGMDEDAHMNHTLLELLKTEFSVRLPELEGELPKDDAGLDVPRIFDIVRAAIRDQVGWEVSESCSLGMFSFAKYLMWRDLVERGEQLQQNAVVRQLAADQREQFPEQIGFPELHSLDAEVDAHKVYTPLSADSSQLAAILAAARGKSFVLEGPPGTGKSQTIANMIAHCLGHGKTVLFVAEKAVALEVVYKRLARIGLSDFCLELHSNKTLASSVMQQYRDAVGCVSAEMGENDWHENVETMMQLRSELNNLPHEMHAQRDDGESLYADVCRLASADGLPTIDPPDNESNALRMSRERRKELLRCAHELAAHYGLIENASSDAAEAICATEPAASWESELQLLLQEVSRSAEAHEKALADIAEQLGLAQEKAASWRRVLLAILAPESAGGDCSALLPHCAGRALSALKKAGELAQKYRSLRTTLTLNYPDATVDEAELPRWLSDCKSALARPWPLSWLGMRRIRKTLQLQASASGEPDCLSDLQTLSAMAALKQDISREEEHIPDFLRHGIHLEESHILTAQHIAHQLADTGEQELCQQVIHRREVLRHDLRFMQRVDECQSIMTKLSDAEAGLNQLQCRGDLLRAACAEGLGKQWAERMLSCKSSWRDIVLWNKKAAEAQAMGLSAWVQTLKSGTTPPRQLEQAAACALSASKLTAADEKIETLRYFSPLLHEEKIRDFVTEDRDLRTRTSAHIRRLLIQRAAGISQYGRETAVLQREISKKRMHMPLRRLLSSTPHITPLLKPCFLMSPLSVAQYLAEDTQPFDVVIFDEASQIPVWDAIGAIGRGKSVIVTGDSRQMPPTSFFARNHSAEEADDESEPNLESILDECLACGVPRMNLTWHYRSKSEALIAFSNANYYEGKMTTFPAPALRDSALQSHFIGGVYESGASRRVNPQEASAVVRHVLSSLRSPGFRYTEATSIGIVTFNAQQQKLISDMLDEARAEDPSLEPFFAEENPEAVFVKNLENVQGDERGVIYFSTTYGRDASGRLAMNFGPLNLTGGERRLNVAVTRARYAMHVFTSMRPEEIDLSRTRARGAADLRAFLEYAAGGARLSTAGLSHGGQDMLAQRIAATLAQHGYKCRLGMGASDYRVDIAVEHPERENAVLAGITLDGESYCVAYTARDRDIVRPETMSLLGWRMLNLWAIDWWRAPDKCLQALLSKLEKLKTLAPAENDELPDLAKAALAGEATKLTEPQSVDTPSEPLHRMPAVESYTAYAPTAPLPPLFEMSDRSIAGLMMDIAAAEAPLSQPRLYHHLFDLAPIPLARNSRAYKQQVEAVRLRLDSILSRLGEHELLHLHEELSLPEEEVKNILIISLPQGPEVRPRTCGPRELATIPPSELREIARLVQSTLRCLPGSDEHLRGICDALAVRTTKRAKELLTKLLTATD